MLFDQVPVGLAHVSLDGGLLRVNAKLCDMLGYAPDEIRGLRAEALLHLDDAEAALGQIRALGDDLFGSSFTADERRRRKDGLPLWVTVNRSLVRDPFGAPLYIVEVVNDIDDRKRAEEARERALAAERAARIRVELAEARVERLQALTSELACVDLCRISEDDRRFMFTLAQQCAQALERARMYEAERRARLLREDALAIAAHDLRNLISSIVMAASLLDLAAPTDRYW